jgi:hypothetical protein
VLIVRVGTAYGAVGSDASVVTPAFVANSVVSWDLVFGLKGDILSEIDDVKGTEPVRRTIIIPNAKRAIPKDREKYSSITGWQLVEWCRREGKNTCQRVLELQVRAESPLLLGK